MSSCIVDLQLNYREIQNHQNEKDHQDDKGLQEVHQYDKGLQGIQDHQGDKGLQGVQDHQGDKGLQGDKDLQGDQKNSEDHSHHRQEEDPGRIYLLIIFSINFVICIFFIQDLHTSDTDHDHHMLTRTMIAPHDIEDSLLREIATETMVVMYGEKEKMHVCTDQEEGLHLYH